MHKERLLELYHQYIKEIASISTNEEIKRYSSKKTITSKILNPQRTAQQKIADAIEDSDYEEGSKAYVFFKKDNSLCLAENFDGYDYNEMKLYEKIYKALQVFSTILDLKDFKNYSLKRNYSDLCVLLGKEPPKPKEKVLKKPSKKPKVSLGGTDNDLYD